MAHRIFERHSSPEPIDGETAEEKDHSGPEKRELAIEPRRAECDLGRRRSTIASTRRRLSRKAFRDRRPVGQMILIDPGLGEPASALRARTTAEGLTGRELDRARCLADDRDAVAYRPRDDGASALEVTGVYTFRAGADAGVKTSEGASSVSRCESHN
jgi:hypothetical protein